MQLEGRQRAGEVLDRHVLEARLLVEVGQVAVRERAPDRVLAGQADVGALRQQRGQRQRLGVAELDPALLQGLPAALERLAELAVDLEAVRDPEQLLVQRAQTLSRGRRGNSR